jgi:dethiobiotin synthetase
VKQKALFVTGTDTNVGKTLVSAILTLGSKGKYWKPIQTGSDIDSVWIKGATELSDEHFFPETYKLTEPLSPHAAAEIDGVTIATSDINLPAHSNGDLLIVEGAGGLLVPINKHDFMADIIKRLGLPAILVARSGLGTINHTLLSLRLIHQLKIPLLGVVLNGERNRGNKAAIEKYGRVEVIAEIEPLASLDRAALQETFNRKLANFVEDFMK